MKKTVLVLFLMVFAISLAACQPPNTVIADATISGVSDVTMALGDEFNRLQGVSAADHDGSDLTSLITVEGVVNVNRAGTYNITYKVTGESGIEVSASRIITVVGNASISGPELLPTSIMVGTPFDPLEGVSASDVDGTDLTAALVVSSSIITDGEADTTVEGVYDITYSVTGQSGKTITVVIQLIVYGLTDAVITFTGTAKDEPTVFYLSAGFELDLSIVATAKDYDNETLTIDEIVIPEALTGMVTNNVFKPTEAGTYQITFKATGKNEAQSEAILTIIVRKQGIEIDGEFIPVLLTNINNDGKPWNSTLIYTELKGKGEYGVIAIVDDHGRIILVRDAYGTQYDLNNPIKQGTPDQIRGIPNNDGWVAADNFQGLLGPQGTPGGIPTGGFAIFFSRDNLTGTTHPIRLLGLLHAREYGALVKVINLDIPNFNPPTNDAQILGADDITIYSNETFDPLAGVTGKDANDAALTVTVAFNNVDLSKPAKGILSQTAEGFADGYYAVVYEVTGANGYTVRVTRRVTVLPAMVDAVIEGIGPVSLAVGQTFDPMAGVTATDYDGTDLTAQITLTGTVDTAVAGEYELTYTVTGGNNTEVVITRTITVAADARFEVDNARVAFVYKGEAFDPWQHIQAIDHDNTNLTNLIVLTSEIYHDNVIDTSVVGIYTLVYTVVGESGNTVTLELTFEVKEVPNATLTLTSGAARNLFVSQTFDLNANATAVDYNGQPITAIEMQYDSSYDAVISNGIFAPTTDGAYTFVYQTTGVNGVLVEKTVVLTVASAGFTIDGVAIPITQADVNRPAIDGKPSNSITIYTELFGMGEFGVLVIVDAHGRVVLTRDAFGEQVDVNNPLKQGNPAFPTNLSGLPNFKTYDLYTGGLWTTWTKGGADTFEGLLGPQGTPGGIPTGGFAIYFQNGTTSRPLGLNNARKFGAVVELYNLVVPNFDASLNDTDARIVGANDIEIMVGDTFDPLSGVTGFDNDNTPLTVTVVFNSVNTANGVITPQPSRVINTQIGRDNYAQGWYSVVYSVTGSNGYTVQVTRRVVVR
ncbi:DUF5011 domain-containing protein [Acholeplasma manati]|uniref:DUF5011 domain-containing protein n=1 Tax=Paracholeplasma manati TaxID=591373 RepID=A0ABT2Y481_9MOLU|nr:DUF5011 domain-containing protein [Paracholeplasma manati]MCV2231531.1 DUF5011 domain-containing protein [Paracholeplasma manati]